MNSNKGSHLSAVDFKTLPLSSFPHLLSYILTPTRVPSKVVGRSSINYPRSPQPSPGQGYLQAVQHGLPLCRELSRCSSTGRPPNWLDTPHTHLKGSPIEHLCDWVLKTPKFASWSNESGPNILWIKGGAGMGKTMLTIDLLNKFPQGKRYRHGDLLSATSSVTVPIRNRGLRLLPCEDFALGLKRKYQDCSVLTRARIK